MVEIEKQLFKIQLFLKYRNVFSILLTNPSAFPHRKAYPVPEQSPLILLSHLHSLSSVHLSIFMLTHIHPCTTSSLPSNLLTHQSPFSFTFFPHPHLSSKPDSSFGAPPLTLNPSPNPPSNASPTSSAPSASLKTPKNQAETRPKMPEKSSSLCPINCPNTRSGTPSIRAGPLRRIRFWFRVRVRPYPGTTTQGRPRGKPGKTSG